MKNNIIILALILTAFIFGCGKEVHEDSHAENNESGLKALSYTLYSDKTELFVEFQPLIVGTESKFAAHFTELGSLFKAFTEGTIKLNIDVNGKSVSVTSTEPQVPGIFQLRLTPDTEGIAKLTFDIETMNFTDKIVIENVRVYADEESAFFEQKEESGGDEITYLKEQSWKVDFANKLIVRQSFTDIIKTSGQILSAPGDEKIVTANASGIVVYSGNNVIGSTVNPGSGMFRITGGNLAEGNIDAGFKEAKANYEKAKTDFERAKELAEDKIISDREFLKYVNEYENALTVFDMISKNYTSEGQVVTSPMPGFLKNIFVSDGQYVTAGTPLASISKNKNLMLQANLSQKYFDRLSSISSANFKTTGSDETFSTQNLNGRVISYGKSLTEGSLFIPVIFEFDNIGNIIPGSAAEVFLKTFSIPDALVIPVSALIEEQGKFYVYVQTGGESFQKREVDLGGNDGLNVQILSGISEGERVVIIGAYQIKLSVAAGTLPEHGHEH